MTILQDYIQKHGLPNRVTDDITGDLEFYQKQDMLVVMDIRTNRWVGIIVGHPKANKYYVIGDNNEVLADTFIEWVVRRRIIQYLEACRVQR